jgi:hypothetical protein
VCDVSFFIFNTIVRFSILFATQVPTCETEDICVEYQKDSPSGRFTYLSDLAFTQLSVGAEYHVTGTSTLSSKLFEEAESSPMFRSDEQSAHQ